MAKSKPQIQKFRETARQLEADKSQEHFDSTLRKIGKGTHSRKDSETKPSPRQKHSHNES